MTKYAAPRPKVFLYVDGDDDICRKAKGTKRCVIEKNV